MEKIAIFEAITAARIKAAICWDVTLYSMVELSKAFRRNVQPPSSRQENASVTDQLNSRPLKKTDKRRVYNHYGNPTTYP
jgi:hypothetical protein